MSAFTRPILIDPHGTGRVLERLDFRPADGDGGFNEAWLQRALFEFPESIPVREIDPHIGELIPVCMEIETGSGPADILYVTPTGQVVLVETKLWRNHEARRQVVGQILDYAKQLTVWNYDILDRKAALAAGTDAGHLLRCLKSRHPAADESTFVDGVGRSLSTGDFLLLIVGDGIRYDAEGLVGFLERFGHLRFGIGLVEVAAYALPDGGRLLQPRVLAKTEVLQRTLLIGPSGPMTFQQAAQAEDSASPSPQYEWFTTFWSEVLEKLKLEDKSVMPAEPARSTNQYFVMPPGGASAWVSAYIAQSARKGGVYLTFARAYEHGLEMYERLESDRQSIEREIGAPLNWERKGDKVYVSVEDVTFKDLNSEPDRSRVTQYLAEMAARMVRVFQTRLAAESRAQT